MSECDKSNFILPVFVAIFFDSTELHESFDAQLLFFLMYILM